MSTRGELRTATSSQRSGSCSPHHFSIAGQPSHRFAAPRHDSCKPTRSVVSHVQILGVKPLSDPTSSPLHGREVEQAAMRSCIQLHNSLKGNNIPKLNWQGGLLEQAYERCGTVTSEYAKTFYLGTQLMTPAQSKAVWAIYVWCRRTDELVDGPNADRITPQVRCRCQTARFHGMQRIVSQARTVTWTSHRDGHHPCCIEVHSGRVASVWLILHALVRGSLHDV